MISKYFYTLIMKNTVAGILCSSLLAGCSLPDSAPTGTNSPLMAPSRMAPAVSSSASRYSEPVPMEELQSRKKDSAYNTEAYDHIQENEFLEVKNNPLSTFAIDVDTASYANMRRFISQNQLPPKDAIKIEELVNYFDYDYPQPKNEHPFSVTTELNVTPWNNHSRLLSIGLQGKKIPMDDLPASNLVFLIDVSGSMSDWNKLPLLKSAFKLLVKQLRAQDRISIVVYAGAAGLVLDGIPGDDEKTIMRALDKLKSGGSTAGGAGIELAYKVAQKHFLSEGNNRIILASDGDFNIGRSSEGELTRLIESKRNDGIYLTVLGFGMGNYKDTTMELLANKGNGNYAYIDDQMEAKKVLIDEFGGTLFSIANDVKLQLEFNPAFVHSYRLIGYENRLLHQEDFNDDKKDAGELGSGHSVTALYELRLTETNGASASVDPLKYQKLTTVPSEDLMTLKLRYKRPGQTESQLLTHSLNKKVLQSYPRVSERFNFASAVAEFGLLLRDSGYKGTASYEKLLSRARNNKGRDNKGYRSEFIRLVEKTILL